jgi:hypothetical protein
VQAAPQRSTCSLRREETAYTRAFPALWLSEHMRCEACSLLSSQPKLSSQEWGSASAVSTYVRTSPCREPEMVWRKVKVTKGPSKATSEWPLPSSRAHLLPEGFFTWDSCMRWDEIRTTSPRTVQLLRTYEWIQQNTSSSITKDLAALEEEEKKSSVSIVGFDRI